ncbi:MAG: hypothetical protein JSW34_11025 [Candidatus Zixiibacteriota bacterium]|nr:MAG: hypothetical protein JSW34_11025 [candidate division Zixibacteria bacterium]
MTKSAKLAAAAISLLVCASVFSRDAANRDDGKIPYESLSAISSADGTVAHRVGRMVLAVTNNGTFGNGFANSNVDFFTNELVLSCEYPRGSNTKYLFAGAFWVGAVVGRDTLVSTAATGWSWIREFNPDEAPFGEIVKRSISSIDNDLSRGAISEEDYIVVYTDTITEGVEQDYFGRPHIPLNIEVTQNSYAWSYSYAEDFVLFDYRVKNIGSNRLEKVYMGIYVDADVYFGQDNSTRGYADDICGFVEAFPHEYEGCEFYDTVNIAWIADNDGDPDGGAFTDMSVRHVTGSRIVRTPADSLDVSFNWWISNTSSVLDFGPRERAGAGRLQEDFRDFRTGGLGTPEGDVNQYYLLRNMEFDYDQIYTASIGPADTLWLYPLQELAGDFADGFDTRYLLSFGPFNIDPGEKLPISFAYVAGENFHRDPGNIGNLPHNPHAFYANIDFSDMALNAAWAGRVYDNPGIDTDGDGYAGKVRLCCCDSIGYSLEDLLDTVLIEDYDPNLCEMIWYEGDGIPDFRGASPPPPPDFWLEPHVGGIRVRINGIRSETTKDIFSGISDFEGYRIYCGRDDRETSFSLMASYDKEDYNKYVWVEEGFELLDVPYTLDSLRCLYGDSCGDMAFHPLDYPQSQPFFLPGFADSIFYFAPQDFNAAEYGTVTPIRRTYPDQPYPSSLNPDSVAADELTEDGRLKYFEYEFVVEDLLPTVPYWINVTAFDFGSPKAGLEALESSVSVGAKAAYPNNSAEAVSSGDLKVYVYPNPYRIDADYRDEGLEGRSEMDRPDNRVRAVHFANLPPRCTISIYSLDGDLIREIEHDVDPADPMASHDEWNLITRNTQAVASGLYYWVVDADGLETQIGKLVIIM